MSAANSSIALGGKCTRSPNPAITSPQPVTSSNPTPRCLNLMEIKMYDQNGNEITPSTCTMDSVYSSASASNCIDGDTSTMCHNDCTSGGWLEIDFGATFHVFLIEVYNRQVGLHVRHSKCAPTDLHSCLYRIRTTTELMELRFNCGLMLAKRGR